MYGCCGKGPHGWGWQAEAGRGCGGLGLCLGLASASADAGGAEAGGQAGLTKEALKARKALLQSRIELIDRMLEKL